MQYHGSQVYIDHQEKIDHGFSQKANWLLQPKLNRTALHAELKSHDHDSPQEGNSLPSMDTMSWIIIVFSIVLTVLVIALTYPFYKNPKFQIAVTANTIEEEMQDMQTSN